MVVDTTTVASNQVVPWFVWCYRAIDFCVRVRTGPFPALDIDPRPIKARPTVTTRHVPANTICAIPPPAEDAAGDCYDQVSSRDGGARCWCTLNSLLHVNSFPPMFTTTESRRANCFTTLTAMLSQRMLETLETIIVASSCAAMDLAAESVNTSNMCALRSTVRFQSGFSAYTAAARGHIDVGGG